MPDSVRVTSADSQLLQLLKWLCSTSPFLDFQWALDDSQVWSQPLKSFPLAFAIRTATLSSVSQVANPEFPFSTYQERFHCHFLQFPSYRHRFTGVFYLSRDSTRLRARSYFLSWRVRPRIFSLVSEITLCSFFTTQRLSRLGPCSTP